MLVVSASPAAAIIGGTTAAEPSRPWAVQVVILEKGALNGLCGGTLVTPQRVVTTGNCINGKSVSDIFVVANEKHLVQESSHLIEVSSASLAPGWKVDNYANDVAVQGAIGHGKRPPKLPPLDSARAKPVKWAARA